MGPVKIKPNLKITVSESSIIIQYHTILWNLILTTEWQLTETANEKVMANFYHSVGIFIDKTSEKTSYHSNTSMQTAQDISIHMQ